MHDAFEEEVRRFAQFIVWLAVVMAMAYIGNALYQHVCLLLK